MKNFACPRCQNKVYFENVMCVQCSHALGFDAKELTVIALESPGPEAGLFRRINGNGKSTKTLLRYCSNATYGVCNWLTYDRDKNRLCAACGLNRTIPNLAEPGSLPAWRDLERAKKRLVYSLLRFGLPFDGSGSTKGPLTFDFVRNATTGHLGGVITIDIMEADAVERERQRQMFGEPYRSLLGHLRHECGHFYWMALVQRAKRLEEFRALFGDERQDYPAALAKHHSAGAPADWGTDHVSAYASAHPWEDWAETWAHYLHMVDAVDTAEAEGMEPRSAGFSLGSIWPFKPYDVYRDETFHSLIERWIPLTLAMNSLSRSMGHDDFYPFMIPPRAYDKLDFVHRVIRERPA